MIMSFVFFTLRTSLGPRSFFEHDTSSQNPSARSTQKIEPSYSFEILCNCYFGLHHADIRPWDTQHRLFSRIFFFLFLSLPSWLQGLLTGSALQSGQTESFMDYIIIIPIGIKRRVFI